MAIARDNATVGSNSGTQASLTFAHTVAGSLRHLTVVVAWRNSASVGSISSITYNGVSMSLITGQTRSTTRVEIWGLVAPATGSNNVVITHSTGFDAGCTALAISHTGVDQTTPAGTPSTANSGTGNPSVAVTSATGELVIDGEVGLASSTTHTVGAGQTQELNQQAGNASAKVGSSTEPGGASVTMSWTYSISPGWATAAFPLKPDTGGGGGGDAIPTGVHSYRQRRV